MPFPPCAISRGCARGNPANVRNSGRVRRAAGRGAAVLREGGAGGAGSGADPAPQSDSESDAFSVLGSAQFRRNALGPAIWAFERALVLDPADDDARYNLERAQRNLDYTTISAPVDGVVIDRRVNIGQTVVAVRDAEVGALPTPELWALADHVLALNATARPRTTMALDASTIAAECRLATRSMKLRKSPWASSSARSDTVRTAAKGTP